MGIFGRKPKVTKSVEIDPIKPKRTIKEDDERVSFYMEPKDEVVVQVEKTVKQNKQSDKRQPRTTFALIQWKNEQIHCLETIGTFKSRMRSADLHIEVTLPSIKKASYLKSQILYFKEYEK